MVPFFTVYDDHDTQNTARQSETPNNVDSSAQI